MKKPDIPHNEHERLQALKQYSILDTVPEEEYDRITKLASFICNAPISLVSLIDDKRQWFKSHYGLDAEFTNKDIAFCAHAINEKDSAFIIPDSRKDDRFHDNPLVIGNPYVIFYAGVPLVTNDGYPLGTLCVIDHEPRKLSLEQIEALKTLADQIMSLLELRKVNSRLNVLNKELENRNDALKQFSRTAAHDIKSPLYNIQSLADALHQQYSNILDSTGLEMLEYIHSSAEQLTELVNGILKYSRNGNLLATEKTECLIEESIKKILKLVDVEGTIRSKIKIETEPSIFTNKIALEQILLNILSNSVKYCNKPELELNISVKSEGRYAIFSISDNGPGIKENDKQRIFQLFETTTNLDSKGEKGSGIGLATVKALVEGLGGDISVLSEEGYGSTFIFKILQS